MDEDIKNLGNWTDEATKQMLYGVIKRKRKFDKLYNFHLIIMWLTLGVVSVIFLLPLPNGHRSIFRIL